MSTHENQSRTQGGPDLRQVAAQVPSREVMGSSGAHCTYSGSQRQSAQRAKVLAVQTSPRVGAQREEIKALQAQATEAQPSSAASTATSNRTGLPDQLKAGIESLSGLSMDHVKVHENSSMPAQLNAMAYAQGRDIHLGPGQERLLPHEAWHVVQQAQGRVAPTMTVVGRAVNANPDLEREADKMGERALAVAPAQRCAASRPASEHRVLQAVAVIQAVWGNVGAADGERVNLENLQDGTFRHNATGRLFTRDADNPAIFHLVPAVEEAAAEAMDIDEPAPAVGPLRAAFRAARRAIETELGRELTAHEWDVVADHSAEAINGCIEAGLDPVAALSGPNGASCIPTSDRLYSLLRTGDEVRRGADDGTNTANRLNALATRIENEAADSIYQVVFGPANHGFVIAVSGGRAEIVQSFANSESLGTNLGIDNFTFTQAEVATLLRNLLDPDETNAAQEAMFDGNIDGHDGDEPIAGLVLRWNRANLRADAGGAIEDELRDRANVLPD